VSTAPKAFNLKDNNFWIKLGEGSWTLEEQCDFPSQPPHAFTRTGSELDKARRRLSKSLRKLNSGRGIESTGNGTPNDRSKANIQGHPVPSGMDANQPEVTPINDGPIDFKTLLPTTSGIWRICPTLQIRTKEKLAMRVVVGIG